MTTSKPDYYATLGLQQTATQEEIKKRYRELARKYHPDVNPSPEAAHKIKAVNEAHRILGDVERRSLYDADRALSAPPPQPKPQPTQAAGPAPRRPAPNPFQRHKPASAAKPTPDHQPRPEPQPSPARPASSSGSSANGSTQSAQSTGYRSDASTSKPKVEFNGFGRTYPEEPRRNSAEGARKTAPDASEELKKLIASAETAFLTRNYEEAERICHQVIARRRTAATAHEILGDIYAMRGSTDQAIKAYSYAIQFDPRNFGLQGKLDRLIGRMDGAGPIVNKAKATTTRSSGDQRAAREAAMAVISVGLFIVGCLALAAYGQNPGLPLGGAIPWLTSLSPNLLFTLVVEGVVSGVLLAFYGRLRPVSEELTVRGANGRGAKVPLLPVLMLFSLVWYYASLLVYVVAALSRNRFSTSTVRIYVVVTALIALFTVMTAENVRGGIDWLAAAAFSGNVLFPSAIAGWFIGDLVRLRKRSA